MTFETLRVLHLGDSPNYAAYFLGCLFASTVGTIFVATGCLKLLDSSVHLRSTLLGVYFKTDNLAVAASRTIGTLEVIVGIGSATLNSLRTPSLLVEAVFLLVATVAISIAVKKGVHRTCGCAGSLSRQAVSVNQAYRNLAIFGASMVAIIFVQIQPQVHGYLVVLGSLFGIVLAFLLMRRSAEYRDWRQARRRSESDLERLANEIVVKCENHSLEIRSLKRSMKRSAVWPEIKANVSRENLKRGVYWAEDCWSYVAFPTILHGRDSILVLASHSVITSQKRLIIVDAIEDLVLLEKAYSAAS